LLVYQDNIQVNDSQVMGHPWYQPGADTPASPLEGEISQWIVDIESIIHSLANDCVEQFGTNTFNPLPLPLADNFAPSPMPSIAPTTKPLPFSTFLVKDKHGCLPPMHSWLRVMLAKLRKQVLVNITKSSNAKEL
jgi:hypothetical protein